MPVIGSVIAVRSISIGVAICVIAMRNTTTSTNLDTINASTNAAHFPIHPRVASQAAPANASGARTIAMRSEERRVGKEGRRGGGRGGGDGRGDYGAVQ